jgi:ABC-type glycerol-3-phosphate transport system substrate-binding protein
MNSASDKKEAGWMFMQWATSKHIQKKLHLKGVPSPRSSVWHDEDVLETLPTDFVETMNVSLEQGHHGPLTPKFGKLQHVLTIELQNVITGQKTAEEAADDTAKEWKKILASS